MPTVEPLDRLTLSARELASSFPPVLRHPNKRLVYSIAYPEGCVHSGTVSYSRWPEFPLPETVDISGFCGRLDLREDLYDYEPVPGFEAGLEWHVNFADPHLFVAYSGPLFAQDEMQLAEHPVLGSLKEALMARGSKPLTVEAGAEAFRKAAKKVTGFSGQNEVSTRDLVSWIAGAGYAWGVSDGN